VSLPAAAAATVADQRMTLLEHIAELRTRLLRSALWVLAGCGACYAWVNWFYELLLQPLKASAPGVDLNYFSPTEPFFVSLRIALTAGLIAASPLVLLELWGFVAPGLTARERRMVAPILPVILTLFLAGVWFVYAMLLPVSIGFLLGIARPDIHPVLDQQQYFGLVTTLCLSGGILFELPAVLGVAGWLGLVNSRLLWNYSSYAFIALMLVAAIITPTGDAFTMLVFTAPLMGLYFFSIAVVWFIQRTRRDPRAT
jgi:sec-independent protein translocase protein TatC